jgi:FkbM family methyltransferase
MLNGRSRWLVARNLLRYENYLALARTLRVCERPVAAARRYFFGSGAYPVAMGIRTPLGMQRATLFGPHDAVTAHEIFCREDYRTPRPAEIVIDLGSNTGLSALYFLTRSSTAVCELYEPDPRNVARLRANLLGFEARYTLHESAVGSIGGVAPFAREPTGRYGTLDESSWVFENARKTRSTAPMEDSAPCIIQVNVDGINELLGVMLDRYGSIDLLKVDTEGTEVDIIRAVEPAIRSRIAQIVIESFDHTVSLPGFDARNSCDTIMLVNQELEPAARGRGNTEKL